MHFKNFLLLLVYILIIHTSDAISTHIPEYEAKDIKKTTQYHASKDTNIEIDEATFLPDSITQVKENFFEWGFNICWDSNAKYNWLIYGGNDDFKDYFRCQPCLSFECSIHQSQNNNYCCLPLCNPCNLLFNYFSSIKKDIPYKSSMHTNLASIEEDSYRYHTDHVSYGTYILERYHGI